jgi:hypothetical protein
MQVITELHDPAALPWSILHIRRRMDPITPPDALKGENTTQTDIEPAALALSALILIHNFEMRRIHISSHYVIKINFNIISHSSYTSEVGYSYRISPQKNLCRVSYVPCLHIYM